jgi:hypothetical protein
VNKPVGGTIAGERFLHAPGFLRDPDSILRCDYGFMSDQTVQNVNIIVFVYLFFEGGRA